MKTLIGPRSKKQRKRLVSPAKMIAALAIFVLLIVAGIWLFIKDDARNGVRGSSPSTSQMGNTSGRTNSDNPLAGRKLYVDKARTVNTVAAEYERSGKTADAQLLRRIADQPGTIWLTGPSANDAASRDIATVTRTSAEAAAQGTTPVYQLYAIPSRDACAAHSKGGFATGEAYLEWIGKIVGALKTDAVINLEADAVAHTINNGCMNAQQIADRYELLNKAASKLAQSPRVLAVYLDAAHPDWFPDPNALVEPLRKAGIEHARGIAVNVSFFAETTAATKWSQQLVTLLGGDKGVMIDTSRNGKGIAPATGEARWCNPPGRGLGPRPTTAVTDASIDAYFWGKNPGESDGACFGNPAAGTFVPQIALELARNAAE